MDPKPSSEPDPSAPLTRRANPALSTRFSRRASTFALGGLVGALAVALLIVVTSIISTPRDAAPLVPGAPDPVAEVHPTPRPTPTATPTPTVDVSESAEEETDAAPDDPATAPLADPQPAPELEPAPSEPAAEEDDSESTTPGRSGTAPGQTKEPKKP
ncbi:hypothetical protein [Microbacterium hibisci]|uniref:hypothetical protein n=1 Tax=Microbacterium hibisci TaxID=2036000 RepID=UPI00194130DB|nr:hypothetical protein [Microbacterium hibisci]